MRYAHVHHCRQIFMRPSPPGSCVSSQHAHVAHVHTRRISTLRLALPHNRLPHPEARTQTYTHKDKPGGQANGPTNAHTYYTLACSHHRGTCVLGSTLGSSLGQALGSTLGSTLGSSLGQALGSTLGSALGHVLSSLFNGCTPTSST